MNTAGTGWRPRFGLNLLLRAGILSQDLEIENPLGDLDVESQSRTWRTCSS